MKILIAEDDPTSAKLLARTLESDGYTVVVTVDGALALEAMRHRTFEALITDWMMPNMDGISLVRRVRAELDAPPPILVVTALSSADAKSHALDAGADDYLAKPYEPREILRRLRNCIDRARQPVPRVDFDPKSLEQAPLRPAEHVGVAIAASTGGPEALRTVIPALQPGVRAAYFLVLHGPAWMLETFSERLLGISKLKVRMAADHTVIETDTVYVCPGEVHLKVEGFELRLSHEPAENFVRPAADPLFRSVAANYGRNGVAVVMTGMGRDGSLGAQHVHHAGGRVLVQDPTTAIAASMPRTTLGMGCVDQIFRLEELGAGIQQHARQLANQLAPLHA